MLRHGFVIGACVLAGLALSRGARAETNHTFQSWTAGFLTARTAGPAGSSPGIWMDLQSRRGNESTVMLVRPGVGWYFDERFSVWAGYLFTPTLVEEGPDRIEHRPWQQFQAALPFGDVALTLRTRFEQRFVDGTSDTGFRLRQLVRGQLKVHDEWALVLWDEMFFGLNETDFGQPSGLDQNRIFLGPAWLPRGGLRLEAGYLSVYLPRDTANTLVHALSVNCFVWF